MRIRASLAFLLGIVAVAAATGAEGPPAAEEARLLRFPAIHGDRIAFTYAGDLYTVSAAGGVARKLTNHDGFEMFARFSPDGKWLAFTGQYDGNTEVYVMPAEGGKPRRLTFTATLDRDDVSDRMGPNNIVMGWKHDSKHVVFRSRMRSFNDFIGQLYVVSLDGGPPEPLPLPRGGFCSFSDDDSKLAYNRVFREFRTWKRYRGGMADDVWVYDFETKKTDNITIAERDQEDSVKEVGHSQSIIPMWKGDRIYFLSDRGPDGRMNLFVFDLKEKKTRRLTDFKDFDVKFPSLGDDAVVFENGGWIYRFDLATEKYDKVPVRILQDDVGSRTGLVSVTKNITDFDVSPDGKRALFGARGEVFTVPAKDGPTRDLTNTSGVHERNATWSPDGKWIAYVSDASGEDEIWLAPQDGKGEPRQLTDKADTYKYEISWSPDSKRILWSDKKLRVQYVDVATKAVRQVVQAKVWEVHDAGWSPDARWVAYSQREPDSLDKVYLYSVDDLKTVAVTDGWYASTTPAFSGDGKYLFFVSERDFNPIYGETEWNHVYRDMARIYFVTLARETPSPFRPRDDEAGEAAKKEPPPDGDKKELVVKVDPEGLAERTLQLPIQPASYQNLHSIGPTVYYVRHGSKDDKPALQMYDLSQRKETALGSARAYVVSADGKKMMLEQDGKYGIVDLPKGPVTLNEPLNLNGLEMNLDRRQEWAEIYHECWRQMRDFFYDADMHGVDWKGVRAKYEPLLAHVNHRADLTYVIGEMIGELDVGHAYAGGGDMPRPERIQTGLLGAMLKRDAASGYYQIVKILHGEAGDPKLRSPLADPGVDAKEGDFIVAVDGRPADKLTDLYEPLVGKVGKQVTLAVNAAPKAKGARDVVVVPISSEADLYYHEWVRGNYKKVADATGGKVGYLHVPDMLSHGLNEFAKQFYPQLHKKALIVDVRGNAGGNISPMLIDRLRRESAMVGISRNAPPHPDPEDAFDGPMVCLMNEFSASDGDLFPYRFRQYHLGALVGKRSWGGVVGIRGTLPLLDGGYLNRPEFSRYDLKGKKWIIEGYGVRPDIVVDDDPAREYAGEDEQLDKAIAVIQEELKTKEKTLPPPPPSPQK